MKLSCLRFPDSLGRILRGPFLVSSLVFFFGCTATDVSERKRTAIDQLLMSTATDEALANVEIPQIRGETVYVDNRYLETYQEAFVLGAIRELLSRNGALLRHDREAAAIIVEPRSGALGADMAQSLVGLPAFPLVVPGAGTFETPELALYSAKKADSVASLALLGYRQDGSHLFSSGPLVGKAHFHQYEFLLLLNINFTNIPAREDY
ncbi:MAG: DUF6655 family protein [Opitutales bacterium]